jgi:hypothetical protein
MKLESIIEGTVLLILVYIVASNPNAFGSVIRSTGSVYVNSVKALQGR